MAEFRSEDGADVVCPLSCAKYNDEVFTKRSNGLLSAAYDL